MNRGIWDSSHVRSHPTRLPQEQNDLVNSFLVSFVASHCLQEKPKPLFILQKIKSLNIRREWYDYNFIIREKNVWG